MRCKALPAPSGSTAFRRSKRCATPLRSATAAPSRAPPGARHSNVWAGGIFAARALAGGLAAGLGAATSLAEAWPTVALAWPTDDVVRGADVCCCGAARFAARGGGGGGVDRSPHAREMDGPAVKPTTAPATAPTGPSTRAPDSAPKAAGPARSCARATDGAARRTSAATARIFFTLSLPPLRFCMMRWIAAALWLGRGRFVSQRSEEHTSELQSLRHLVCRLL